MIHFNPLNSPFVLLLVDCDRVWHLIDRTGELSAHLNGGDFERAIFSTSIRFCRDKRKRKLQGGARMHMCLPCQQEDASAMDKALTFYPHQPSSST